MVKLKRKPNEQGKGEVEVEDANGANVKKKKKDQILSDIMLFQSHILT